MIKKTRKLISNPLFSGSVIMIGGSMGVNVINYLYHLIVGRLLGPAGYGVLISLFSIFYLSSVVPISSSFAIVKFISSAKDEKERASIYKSIRKLMFYFAVTVSILLIVFSTVISDFLRIGDISIVLLVSPIIFFTLITIVNQATFQGQLRFAPYVGAIFTSSIVKLLLGILFILIGFSVLGAVGAMLIGAFLAFLYTVWKVGDIAKAKVKSDFDLKSFLKYTFPVLVQALAFTSIFSTDIILVKHFLPDFEVGLYAALATLGKVVYFAAQPVTGVMFPIISKKRSKGESYREVFIGSFFLTVFIAVTVVLFYYLFPGIAIGLLFGKDYLSASSELVWMGAFIAIYTASYIIVNFLLSINKTKIVVLPFLAALAQIAGIWRWHSSILQVIQVSLLSTLALFAGLTFYLGYNQLQKVYAKK